MKLLAPIKNDEDIVNKKYVDSTADKLQSQIDNIQIGGRNYLLNTKTFSTASSTSLNGSLITGTTLLEEKYRDLAIRGSTVAEGETVVCRYNFTDFNLGDTFTFSFYAKGDVSKLLAYFHGNPGYVEVAKSVNSQGATATNADGWLPFYITSEWQRYWVTWTLKSTGDISVPKYVMLRTKTEISGQTVYVCGCKFEKGNKATDWSPAPEDVDNNIAAAIDAVDIGSRNIVTGTDTMTIGSINQATWKNKQWRQSGTGTIETIDITETIVPSVNKGAKFIASTAGKQIGICQDLIPLNNNNIYTLSCWVRGSSSGLTCRLQPFYASSTDTGGIGTFTLTGEWQYISYTTNKSPQNTTNYSGAYIYLIPTAAGDTLEVCGIKLERGDKATDWSPAPEDTDKVTSKIENPETVKTYYPTWVTNSTTGEVLVNDGIRYTTLQGTTDTNGYGILILGNGIVSETEGNKYGAIRLYSTGAYYGQIAQIPGGSDNAKHALPTASGTILNTGTTSFTPSLTSGTAIGTLKINNKSTTLYAPTNTDTKVTSVENHYSPSADSSAALSASASGATAAWSIDVVKGVTLQRDAKGHVTGMSVTSGKIPANPNTDTKVTQTVTTSNASYPLLLAPNGQTATATTTAYFDSGVTLNPSTNTIAANISGSSASCTGNAATATKLTTSAGSATQPVYFSDGKPVSCTYTLGKSVPSDAVFTDTKVTNTLATTTKAYITGTTTATTNTGTQVFDTGVYLDTTAGMLTATTFKGKHTYDGGNTAWSYKNIKSSFEKGTIPTDYTQYWALNFMDKNGGDIHENRVGYLTSYVAKTTGTTITEIVAMKNEKDSSDSASIAIGKRTNGAEYLKLGSTTIGGIDTPVYINAGQVTPCNLLPFVVGTQTAITGTWVGNAPTISSLFDGLTIRYWLPYGGSGNATLNLTLADGTNTGDINCYYGGTSRLTTHYGAGNIITLTYRKDVSIAGSTDTYTGWWADANYNSNNRVQITTTNPSSSSTYYIPFSSSASSSGAALLANDGFRMYSLQGTDRAVGYDIPVIGNSTPAGTAGNKYGAIRLYSQSAYYGVVTPIGGVGLSANRTWAFPDKNITVAGTSSFTSGNFATTTESLTKTFNISKNFFQVCIGGSKINPLDSAYYSSGICPKGTAYSASAKLSDSNNHIATISITSAGTLTITIKSLDSTGTNPVTYYIAQFD